MIRSTFSLQTNWPIALRIVGVFASIWVGSRHMKYARSLAGGQQRCHVAIVPIPPTIVTSRAVLEALRCSVAKPLFLSIELELNSATTFVPFPAHGNFRSTWAAEPDYRVQQKLTLWNPVYFTWGKVWRQISRDVGLLTVTARDFRLLHFLNLKLWIDSNQHQKTNVIVFTN